MDFGNFADTCFFQRSAGIIEQTVVFTNKVKCQLPSCPCTQPICRRRWVNLQTYGFKLIAHVAFDFLEYIHADALQRIACSSFASLRLPQKSLGADDGFGSVKGVFERYETKLQEVFG